MVFKILKICEEMQRLSNKISCNGTKLNIKEYSKRSFEVLCKVEGESNVEALIFRSWGKIAWQYRMESRSK